MERRGTALERWSAFLVAVLFLVFVGTAIAFRLAFAAPVEGSQFARDEQLAVVWEAWDTLSASYSDAAVAGTNAAMGRIPVEAAVAGAIEEMLALSEESLPDFQVQIELSDGPLPRGTPRDLASVWYAWRLLRSSHPELPPDDLARAAILGLTNGIGDPALHYLSQEGYKETAEYFQGEYEGIGALVDEVDGVPVIVQLFPGGPGEEAGLRPGDRIAAVDGGTLQGLFLEEVLQNVRGPQGTKVLLGILSLADRRLWETTLLRGPEDGEHDGTGLRLAERDGVVTVMEVVPGGPAAVAGLAEGDQVLVVAGQLVGQLFLERVVDRIRGPTGTTVRLEVLGSDDGESREISLVRSPIDVPTVSTRVLPEAIGYIQISRFHRKTGEEFKEALQELQQEGVRGVLLDLRYNPGGSVKAAVQVASQFLNNGLVLYEISNSGERIDWPVDKGGMAPDIPVAVLVNRYSASSAEVVAGALQDRERAVLYGTRTFGKGVVQTLKVLSDGSALYVTVARWYTPGDRLIQDVGIEPDVVVMPNLLEQLSGVDAQLREAYLYLLSMIVEESAALLR